MKHQQREIFSRSFFLQRRNTTSQGDHVYPNYKPILVNVNH